MNLEITLIYMLNCCHELDERCASNEYALDHTEHVICKHVSNSIPLKRRMAINAADGIYIHLCVNTRFVINGVFASTLCKLADILVVLLCSYQVLSALKVNYSSGYSVKSEDFVAYICLKFNR